MSRSHQPRTDSKHARSAVRPRLELLEDRTVPGFLAPVNYAVGAPQTVATGDFNRDGTLDLVVCSGAVGVLLGRGDGTFGPPSFVNIGASTLADSVAVGDVNADGSLDLVVGFRTISGPRRPPGFYEWSYDIATSAAVLLGNGNGTFQAPQTFAANNIYTHMPTVYSVPSSVAVGDFNDDGTLDIAVTSRTGLQIYAYETPQFLDDHVTVLIGHGDGGFAPVSGVAGLNGDPGSLVTGDFNGDGHLDLVTAGGDRLLGRGDGTLQETLWTGVVGDDVAAADLNGDGRLDLAVAVSWADALRVSLGNGDGTFGAAATYNIPFPTAVTVADFNIDGHLDLAVAEAGASLGVLLGDGNGGFEARAPAAVGATAYGLAVGNFNSDLFPDVATANSNANTVSVIINDGQWLASPLPSLSISDASIQERNTGQTALRFNVVLSAPAGQTVTVNWATSDGSASSGSDFQGASGTLSFLPGQTSKTIDVIINGDRVAEPDETFFVNLTQATNAMLADGQGRGTIVDDEPRITITDVAKKEGRSGTTLLVFTVNLSHAYDQAVTVNYATADVTATAVDRDYQAASGTLTFAPGETSKAITVVVYGDRKIEGDESFTVNLTGASTSALITDGTGIGTILNDDH